METIIEIKCPYASRNYIIDSATVPYLYMENSQLALKQTSPAYYQIQGGLYCTGRKYANLIIYTYKNVKVLYIPRNEVFITEMISKLEEFYEQYYKNEILTEYLYFTYKEMHKK